MDPLRREGRVFYDWITNALEKYGAGLPYIRISELEDVAAPVSSSAIPLLSHLAKKLAGDRSTTMADYKLTTISRGEQKIIDGCYTMIRRIADAKLDARQAVIAKEYEFRPEDAIAPAALRDLDLEDN